MGVALSSALSHLYHGDESRIAEALIEALNSIESISVDVGSKINDLVSVYRESKKNEE